MIKIKIETFLVSNSISFILLDCLVFVSSFLIHFTHYLAFHIQSYPFLSYTNRSYRIISYHIPFCHFLFCHILTYHILSIILYCISLISFYFSASFIHNLTAFLNLCRTFKSLPSTPVVDSLSTSTPYPPSFHLHLNSLSIFLFSLSSFPLLLSSFLLYLPFFSIFISSPSSFLLLLSLLLYFHSFFIFIPSLSSSLLGATWDISWRSPRGETQLHLLLSAFPPPATNDLFIAYKALLIG